MGLFTLQNSCGLCSLDCWSSNLVLKVVFLFKTFVRYHCSTTNSTASFLYFPIHEISEIKDDFPVVSQIPCLWGHPVHKQFLIKYFEHQNLFKMKILKALLLRKIGRSSWTRLWFEFKKLKFESIFLNIIL